MEEKKKRVMKSNSDIIADAIIEFANAVDEKSDLEVLGTNPKQSVAEFLGVVARLYREAKK